MKATQVKILDTAEKLTQTRGFGGFSYLDIAEAVGIKAPSIHYYYKNKDALALALVKRIQETHGSALSRMNQDIDEPKVRLENVVSVFKAYVEENKICLCGMIATELSSVSREVAESIAAYFQQFQDWLSYQFESLGDNDAASKALVFLCALEGSVILARLKSDPCIVDRAMSTLMPD